ncbi:2,3-bisphosphoglycerate-independent phosphoglycerate mutase [Leptospira sp. GIMC2001]|uniref:2,3-bisphosphoglycerate-independent phosphoglycerate mutase n=1 Tax=Leptospira sp. GIMC2001 TaxID=1513297 RepID=UPI00234968FB|nr:2,3-bisphosphoglycerate-independent phosphoglycerate mutase [Leptospira sp. GIMC2001]WCL50022.1 2,3-bisphosphoglycerate-independent phosphoglycerate mutase [Leptospira sp. GIMC2001]
MLKLERNDQTNQETVLIVVLDGVGSAKFSADQGNAIRAAKIPNLNYLWNEEPTIEILAHGVAVGMPSDDDMGNSEVGHNVLGCGRIYDQGAKLVSKSIETGEMFAGDTWNKLIQNCITNKSTLHFLGLFSDGNVHAHIDHLQKMIEMATEAKVAKIRIHILLDGRDVPEKSALDYLIPFEEFLTKIRNQNVDIEIASGGGRMTITMDRYEADWSMVERGWKTHVLGEGRIFPNAKQAIETLRTEDPGVIDQYLPAFVVGANGKPNGTVEDHDSVIFFNFRGDRAIEISRAFTDKEFNFFDRERFPAIEFAGMMQYDGDLFVPPQYLVTPPAIERTMGQYFAEMKIPQYAISETQKYGHVTYFWNGNKSGFFDKDFETFLEIKSDNIPFDQAPRMKCEEITDTLIKALESGKFKFYRVNYPNGDMVGHTGNMKATIASLEALDEQIARLKETCDRLGIVMLVTADHGNADEMYQLDKKGNPIVDTSGKPTPKTSHTLNPVNLTLYDPKKRYKLDPNLNKKFGMPGLANIAATIMNLMGYNAPEDYRPSLLAKK